MADLTDRLFLLDYSQVFFKANVLDLQEAFASLSSKLNDIPIKFLKLVPRIRSI